jgi:glutathione S-transferase
MELGLPVTAVKADIRKKVLENGESFLKINPKGQVPTLQLENGEILTEGVAIVQYFASLAPEKKMIPEGFAKFHQLEWLNFITTELHKGYSPLFRDNSEEVKTSARANILSQFNYLETALAKNTYLMGDTFTCADAYLFTVLSWSAHVKIELPQFIQEYLGRVSARPAVQAAMKAEGLIK